MSTFKHLDPFGLQEEQRTQNTLEPMPRSLSKNGSVFHNVIFSIAYMGVIIEFI
jgi:hypothetical protein